MIYHLIKKSHSYIPWYPMLKIDKCHAYYATCYIPDVSPSTHHQLTIYHRLNLHEISVVYPEPLRWPSQPLSFPKFPKNIGTAHEITILSWLNPYKSPFWLLKSPRNHNLSSHWKRVRQALSSPGLLILLASGHRHQVHQLVHPGQDGIHLTFMVISLGISPTNCWISMVISMVIWMEI